MKVTLFKDIPQESWPSMERYGEALYQGLRRWRLEAGRGRSDTRSQRSEIRIERFSISGPRSGLKILPFRFLVYPLLAKFNQGDVNHVLDHSYGHLLYWLDLQRTVVTCHDLIPLDYEKEPLALRMFRYSIGGLKKAARVIADSEATKKDLVEKLGIDEGKIRVVYLGVEETFKPISDKRALAEVGEKYKLPKGKLILHVGNNLEYKNISGLLKAFAEVLNQEKEVWLLKVGAEFTGSQQRLIKELGIAEKVTNLGYVAEEDLPAVYSLVNVLVQPSFKEGFGFPVLEAMACGTPVVCSNVSSLPEVGGKVATYCSPQDPADVAQKILGVLCFHVLEHENISQEGLKQAAKFSWEKCARETLGVYQEVAKSRKQ